jgi:hypothetical protein
MNQVYKFLSLTGWFLHVCHKGWLNGSRSLDSIIPSDGGFFIGYVRNIRVFPKIGMHKMAQ